MTQSDAQREAQIREWGEETGELRGKLQSCIAAMQWVLDHGHVDDATRKILEGAVDRSTE